MIRFLRWCWDLLVASLTPIREDLAACCGCGRYRVQHVFLKSGEMWCDNCFRRPGTRMEISHVSFTSPVIRRTWGAVVMYVAHLCGSKGGRPVTGTLFQRWTHGRFDLTARRHHRFVWRVRVTDPLDASGHGPVTFTAFGGATRARRAAERVADAVFGGAR